MDNRKIARAITILPRPLAIPIKIVGHPKDDACEHRQIQTQRKVVDAGVEPLLANPNHQLIDRNATDADDAELKKAVTLPPTPRNHCEDGSKE